MFLNNNWDFPRNLICLYLEMYCLYQSNKRRFIKNKTPSLNPSHRNELLNWRKHQVQVSSVQAVSAMFFGLWCRRDSQSFPDWHNRNFVFRRMTQPSRSDFGKTFKHECRWKHPSWAWFYLSAKVVQLICLLNNSHVRKKQVLYLLSCDSND